MDRHPDQTVTHERELWCRACAGDSAAYAEFVAICERRIRAVLRRLLDDERDVDEAAQDAFVQAWRNRHKFCGDSNLDADGDTDVAIVNRLDGLRVYRNDTPGRSLTARLASTECASAGATVSIEAGGRLHHRVLMAHTFLGVHAYEAIIGVGQAQSAQVDVTIRGFGSRKLQVDLGDGRTLLEVDCRARAGYRDVCWRQSVRRGVMSVSVGSAGGDAVVYGFVSGCVRMRFRRSGRNVERFGVLIGVWWNA